MHSPPRRDDVSAIVECAERANEALRGDVLRDAVERVTALRTRADLCFHGQPLTDLLRPALLPAAVLERARERAEAVARVLRHVAGRAAASAAARARMGFSSPVDFLFDLELRAPSARAAARLDGFLDETGAYRVLEYNAISPGGMYENDALRSAFLESLLLKTVVQPTLVSRSCLEDVHDVLSSMFGRPPRVAVVTSEPVDFEGGEYSNILRFLLRGRDHGWRFVFAGPEQMACTEEGVLLRDEPIDIVVIGDDKVAVPPLFTLGATEVSRRHLETGAVRFLNGLTVGQLLSYKGLLAVVPGGEDGELLGGVDRDALACARDTIPWTRLLRPGPTTTADGSRRPLESHVLERREELVLKPCAGAGGRDIVLGWLVTPETWEREVTARLSKGHDIVQERVRPIEVPWPRLTGADVEVASLATSLDLWLWRDDHATFGYVRTLTGGLANQSRGSMATTVFGL